jgi:hypothetical protein
MDGEPRARRVSGGASGVEGVRLIHRGEYRGQPAKPRHPACQCPLRARITPIDPRAKAVASIGRKMIPPSAGDDQGRLGRNLDVPRPA